MHSKEALIAEFHRLMDITGWRKAEAARRLGMSPSTVVRYLQTGVNPKTGKPKSISPSITVLKLFSKISGIPLQLPGESTEDWGDRGQTRALQPWEVDVLDLVRRIAPERRNDVIAGLRLVLDAMRTPITYRESSLTTSDKLSEIAHHVSSIEAVLSLGGKRDLEGPERSAPAAGQVDDIGAGTKERDRVESQRRSIAEGVGQKRSHPRKK